MRRFMRFRAGQSMVEFAVLAPIFFLLLLGTIDLGRAVYTYNAISNAAREGARAGVPFDSPLPTNASVVAAVPSKLGGGFSLETYLFLLLSPLVSPRNPPPPEFSSTV